MLLGGDILVDLPGVRNKDLLNVAGISVCYYKYKHVMTCAFRSMVYLYKFIYLRIYIWTFFEMIYSASNSEVNWIYMQRKDYGLF